MYGLKEAGVLAFNKLVKSLAPNGYEPMPHPTSLWQHRTLKTTFSLCFEDFGVKYFSKIDDDHLINALQKNYNIIHPSKIPQEIKNKYKYVISADGLVYLNICKGMYGLKESGVLALN